MVATDYMNNHTIIKNIGFSKPKSDLSRIYMLELGHFVVTLQVRKTILSDKLFFLSVRSYSYKICTSFSAWFFHRFLYKYKYSIYT